MISRVLTGCGRLAPAVEKDGLFGGFCGKAVASTLRTSIFTIERKLRMSLSGISANSLLDSSFYTSLLGDSSETTAMDGASAATSTTAAASATGSTDTTTLGGINSDLATLLKALALGDTSGAKSDLSKLKSDLKMQAASLATSSLSSSDGSSDPLNNLLSQITASLQSGSTSGALSDLANYFVQNGQSTGTLVSTMA